MRRYIALAQAAIGVVLNVILLFPAAAAAGGRPPLLVSGVLPPNPVCPAGLETTTLYARRWLAPTRKRTLTLAVPSCAAVLSFSLGVSVVLKYSHRQPDKRQHIFNIFTHTYIYIYIQPPTLLPPGASGRGTYCCKNPMTNGSCNNGLDRHKKKIPYIGLT